MTVLNLDCRHGLAMLPDNSVDAILTDPPYELGFMGHAWDRSGIAYDVAMWREALRVLKPGGHMLAFSGSRTYHRMTCAIEDAGFEVRDSIMWVYGSGFPKSLDISKAIDKISATSTAWFGPWLKKWREATGVSQKELCERCGFFGAVNRGGTIANWELGLGAPSIAQFNIICRVLNLPFGSIEAAERSVIGTRKVNAGVAFSNYGAVELQITAPATMAAQIWEGWGTGLKPAHEPICVARKPMAADTVAANVMAWGVGGINVDGCRIAIDPVADASQLRTMSVSQHDGADGWGMNTTRANPAARVLGEEGRWPANFIHDGSPEVLEMFPDATGAKAAVRGTEWSPASSGQVGNFRERVASAEPRGDSGSAARFYQQCQWAQEDLERALFYYCAKASKREKGADNKHPTVKPVALGRYLARLICPPGGTLLDLFAGSGSFGISAKLEGFGFLGFEKDPESTNVANARIARG